MSYELVSTSEYLDLKNVLLIRVDLSGYLIDYYDQRKGAKASITAEQDAQLKDLISAFAIHLAARSAFETHAWTVTLISERPYSLFVTGNTGELDDKGVAIGFLVGNILTEHIRYSDMNTLHTQCMSRGRTFNSHVASDDPEIIRIIEKYYDQSEQRPIRILLSDTDDTALGLVALTGNDLDWFKKVDIRELAASLPDSERTHMRTCKFSFKCDCSAEKLLPYFQAIPEKELDELYGEDEELVITCPRCGRRFTVDRSIIGESA